MDSYPQAKTEPLLSDTISLLLALPVPWARGGEAAGEAAGVAEGVTDGVAKGVTEGVCRITVSLDTEGEGDRQVRSLSSKIRSVST